MVPAKAEPSLIVLLLSDSLWANTAERVATHLEAAKGCPLTIRRFEMKLFSLTLALAVIAAVPSVHAAKYSKGYIKKNGTYVAPHFKTAPDKSRHNNFSTKGNTNPYTGKKGYKSPYKF